MYDRIVEQDGGSRAMEADCQGDVSRRGNE